MIQTIHHRDVMSENTTRQISRFDASRLQLEALKEWQATKMFCVNATPELRNLVKKAIRDLQPSIPKKNK